MLTKLFIENFQSLMFPQGIRLAPLTLIVGANSSGKSSISRALRLFQQSFEQDELHFAGERVDLTSFKTAVSQHDTRNQIKFGLDITSTAKSTGESYELLYKSRNLSFTISGEKSAQISEFSGGGEFLLRERGSSDSDTIGGGVFSFEAVRPRSNSKYLKLSFSVASGEEHLNKFFEYQKLDGEHLFPLTDERAPSNLDGLLLLDGEAAHNAANWSGIPLKMRGMRPQISIHPDIASLPQTAGMVVSYHLMKLVSHTFLNVSDIVSEMLSVAPLRSIISGPTYRPVGKHSLSSNGDNVQQVLLAMDDENFKKVSDLLEKLTRGKYKIIRLQMRSDDANIGDFARVALLDSSNGDQVPVLFQDAGVGISQVLPILVAILRSPLLPPKPTRFGARQRGLSRVTFIEQPELHLHPEMQADLADLLIEAVKPGKKRDGNLIRHSQILVETHSESMIMRIQKRIREGKLDASDVAIIGVDKFAGGGSLAQEYRISSEGQLVDELPRDFSTLRLNELL
jgi:predicted ATPase